MKLLFGLFNYFPYGGLERDMLTVALVCQARGHDVTIYTEHWQGAKPANTRIIELPGRGLTNHGRAAVFIKQFQQVIAENPDSRVVGFNKMPGLDFYYAADVCFAEKAYEERSWFYRIMPRCKTYLSFEAAVFGRENKTRVLMISKAQTGVYQKYYQTPDERMYLLPPGIRRDRCMPDHYATQRQELRAACKLGQDDKVMIMVGSDYRRKGLDRALHGIAALDKKMRNKTYLWVIGQDDKTPFVKLARDLGIEKNISFLGARDDVSQLLWTADALIHPAYSENTGTVLLEGVVAGLPVISSRACGYSYYIEENELGCVIEEPVSAKTVAKAVSRVFSVDQNVWQKRCGSFAQTADIYSMPERFAEYIEKHG
ncbi:MAG: glycosyltransferase family 4 protein [Syntrophaceae bacterium]|nr:glycosyltransferase family 4 protein [Syntrophaceae bacterium]